MREPNKRRKGVESHMGPTKSARSRDIEQGHKSRQIIGEKGEVELTFDARKC
jgi:hypothetical protein